MTEEMQKEIPKNIFDDDYMKIKGQEYINAVNSNDNSFSWMSENDAKVLDLKKKYVRGQNKGEVKTSVEDVRSINFGVPNMVIGNYETAEFYLCLLNPRTQDSTKVATSIQEYVERETGRPKDEILNGVDKSGNNFKNEYYSQSKDYKNHLINTTTNIIADEIEKLYLMVEKEKEKDANITDLKSMYNKYGDDVFQTAYYVRKYYHFVFNKQFDTNDGKDILFELYNCYKNNPEEFGGLRKLKICDLELIPYRTDHGVDIFDDFCENLKSSQYVANIIINRILDNPDDSLKFVFRSYGDWTKVIKHELGVRLGLIKNEEKLPSKIPEQIEAEFNSKFLKHFYKFPNIGASLSMRNLRVAATGERISKEDYEALEEIFQIGGTK